MHGRRFRDTTNPATNGTAEMSTGTDIYTFSDFMGIADEKRKAHLLDGVIVMESPASTRHEELQNFLAILVGGFVAEKDLGTVYGAHTAYKLDEHNVVEPDLSFVSKRRRSLVQTNYVDGAPDLAVEIISRGTRRLDNEQKRPAYERAGTHELWIVDYLREQSDFLVLDKGQFKAGPLERGRYYSSRALKGFRVDAHWFKSDPLPKPMAILRKLLKQSPRQRAGKILAQRNIRL